MRLWIVYCAQKDAQLRSQDDRFYLNFDNCIREIEKGNYVVILSPNRKHKDQKSFLIMICDYPIVVPFNKRDTTIQLITFFPDRRYKNG